MNNFNVRQFVAGKEGRIIELEKALKEIASHDIGCQGCGKPPRKLDSCDIMQAIAKLAMAEGDKNDD